MKKLLLVLVLAVSVSFAGIDVLVAHCDPGATSQAEAAITHGDYDSVDFMNVSTNSGTTPDVTTLAAYDVVVTWMNYPYADTTAMGNNLADYVDGGGKVVILTFGFSSSGHGLAGRIVDDAAYSPLTTAGTNFVNTTLDSFDHHLIMDGVTTIDDLYFTLTCDLVSSATWIADLADGYDLAAINATEDVVALNIAPGDYHHWTGDGWVMINNAIRYLGTLVTDDTDPNDVIGTFTPDSNLPPDTITCTVAAGLADDAGNATTSDIVWSFDTTGSAIEETT